MTRHEGAREALIGAFPPPLPPPAQYWPFAACKTLLEERIGWVEEDALVLDDCDTVGGSLRYWSTVPILAAPFQHAHGLPETFSVNGQMGHHSPGWAWRKVSSLHTPRTTDCTCHFQMQRNIRFSKTAAVLGRSAVNCRGGTLPETQLRTSVKDLSLPSNQRLLANDLQANHNCIFFYCAENATNIKITCIRFPTSIKPNPN
jgi:hypothetical protein